MDVQIVDSYESIFVLIAALKRFYGRHVAFVYKLKIPVIYDLRIEILACIMYVTLLYYFKPIASIRICTF